MGYIDEEVARVENNPSYSVADNRAAQSFKLTWEGRWKAQVQERVRNNAAGEQEEA